MLLLLLLRDVTQACQGERMRAPRWGARLAAVAQGARSCWITPGERSSVCSVGGQAVAPPSGAEMGMWRRGEVAEGWVGSGVSAPHGCLPCQLGGCWWNGTAPTACPGHVAPESPALGQ